EGRRAGGWNADEQGWAVTAAWTRPIREHVSLTAEALTVRSDRSARMEAPSGLQETSLQMSVRVAF
ncbi:MAG: hypothetical protein MI723_03570, partial [Caulobacterales bacterium]|nr:hypothetical protein [Caulobacterales bacterium]